MNYPVPAQTVRFEQSIKKSRFIATTGFASSKNEIADFLNSVAKEFPDAGHLCRASITGSPDSGIHNSNDAGEPSGTAGKPILNVLQHSGIGDIIIVVARYFGGIKLGSGGLARAYSSCAAGSLTELPTKFVESTITLALKVDFSYENSVRHQLGLLNATGIEATYEKLLTLTCKLPSQNQAELTKVLNNSTRGTVKLHFTNNTHHALPAK